jgi:hypothetical protein
VRLLRSAVNWPKLLCGLVLLCWQPPVPPGVVKSPPSRRHKPLLGLLAQPPLRLLLVEAVHVHMLACRAQLELRAQLPALQVAVKQ